MTLCRLGIAGNRPRPEEGLVSGGKIGTGDFFGVIWVSFLDPVRFLSSPIWILVCFKWPDRSPVNIY
jgi:hypothetical protein